MKMFLDDFKVLDMSELIAVNGGYSGTSGGGNGGYSSPSVVVSAPAKNDICLGCTLDAIASGASNTAAIYSLTPWMSNKIVAAGVAILGATGTLLDTIGSSTHSCYSQTSGN